MSLVAGVRWSFQRIRVQLDRTPSYWSKRPSQNEDLSRRTALNGAMRPHSGTISKYAGDRRLLPRGESVRAGRYSRYGANPS